MTILKLTFILVMYSGFSVLGFSLRTTPISNLSYVRINHNLSLIITNLNATSEQTENLTLYRGNATLGEKCKISEDCNALGAYCDSGHNYTCRCQSYLKVSTNKLLCEGSKLYESCTDNGTCMFEDDNSFCRGNKCMCSPGFPIEIHSRCYKDYIVGTKCNYTSECEIGKQFCENRICTCSMYFPVIVNGKCYEKISPGGNCIFTQQCQAQIYGTVCDWGKCRCKNKADIISSYLHKCIPDKSKPRHSNLSVEPFLCVILLLAPLLVGLICVISWKFKSQVLLNLWRQRLPSLIRRSHSTSESMRNTAISTVEDCPPNYEEAIGISKKPTVKKMDSSLPNYENAIKMTLHDTNKELHM